MQALYSCLQNCSQLIQTIEDTGTIMREVRDLEEQVRSGKGNGGRPEGSSVKADNLQLQLSQSACCAWDLELASCLLWALASSLTLLMPTSHNPWQKL